MVTVVRKGRRLDKKKERKKKIYVFTYTHVYVRRKLMSCVVTVLHSPREQESRMLLKGYPGIYSLNLLIK